jgi:CRISP-associated protein Cas1
MIGRFVEIAEDGRHLSVHRGFMVVAQDREEIGRFPLDDLGAVIASAHGLTYSNNLLVALAERNVPFVLTAANHTPAAFLWPVSGHHHQTARMAAQANASKPLCKRLWRDVVRSKITHQAAALARHNKPTAPLEALVPKVRAGDPENIEAQAAKKYWRSMFGTDFRRDRSAPGLNAMLNYGYMVMRAACARAVLGAGLHPSLGIHHHNPNNAMPLVDDLLEPFRPLIDLTVINLVKNGASDVTPETKSVLASAVHSDMRTKAGISPVLTCMAKLTTSLGQIYQGEGKSLELPLPSKPLEIAVPKTVRD